MTTNPPTITYATPPRKSLNLLWIILAIVGGIFVLLVLLVVALAFFWVSSAKPAAPIHVIVRPPPAPVAPAP